MNNQFESDFTTFVLDLPFSVQLKNLLLFNDNLYIYVNTLDEDVVLPKKYIDYESLKLYLNKDKFELKKDIIIIKLYFEENFFECLIPIKSIWAYQLTYE